MAEIVLFHSGLGLRPGVLADAERLREHGHVVHTPDLFGGAVFDDMAEATAFRDSLGIAELMRRASEAVAALPPALVFAGYSMGAAAAEAQTVARPGARAAILLHGALPMAAIGGSWPSGVPVAVHYGEDDALVEAADVDAFVADVRASGSAVERFTYPTAGHLFADADTEDFDQVSANLMWQRVVRFLERLSSS